MELDFKIDPKGNIFNSGVQIRSHSRPEKDRKRQRIERVYGYQVEIDTKAIVLGPAASTSKAAAKTRKARLDPRGTMAERSLKDNEAAQKERHLGEWNHLKIVAKGHRIQTWINGVPAADFTENDEKAFSPKGFIALQVHAVGKLNETQEVRFKNIKLTTLD